MKIHASFYVAFALAFTLSSAQADDLFTNLRNDRSIPSHCAETSADFFQKTPKTFTFGAAGATQRGFDYEYRMSRHGANLLWRYFNGKVSRRTIEDAARREPVLLDQMRFMEQNKGTMDFTFGSEGEVLEIFAMREMHQHYPASEYYITGSVAYQHFNGGRRIGELDVVIGKLSDCTVVAIGEVKLGKRIGKARQQLARFIGFYKSVIRDKN